MLSVDVMATISLIDRFDFPARNTLKSSCVSDHVADPDVLTEHTIKFFSKVRLRHIVLSLLNIVRNSET